MAPHDDDHDDDLDLSDLLEEDTPSRSLKRVRKVGMDDSQRELMFCNLLNGITSPPKKRLKIMKTKAVAPMVTQSTLVAAVEKKKKKSALALLQKTRTEKKQKKTTVVDPSEKKAMVCSDEQAVSDVDEVISTSFYTPVRDTVEGTVFPIDFLSPGGLAMLELNAYGQHCRQPGWINTVLKNDSRDSYGYNGHNDYLFQKLASALRVQKPPPMIQSKQEVMLSRAIRQKKSYILPTSISAQRKFARFIFRMRPTIDEMPRTFPFVFYPFTHSYQYTKDNGVENWITGTLSAGYSCTLRLTGFRPYFFIQLPRCMQKMDIKTELYDIFKELLRHLNVAVRGQLAKHETFTLDEVMDSLVTPEPLFERHVNNFTYQGPAPSLFLKIHVAYPPLVRYAKLLLQRPYGDTTRKFGDQDEAHTHESWLPSKFVKAGILSEGFIVLEAHVDYTTRFLVDPGLSAGGAWFVFNVETLMVLAENMQLTQSNVEIITSYKNIRSASEEYVEKHPPVYVSAAFDIECKTSIRFPKPDQDPVISIVIRSRFGNSGEAIPENPKTLVDTAMPSGVTIRKKGCTIAVCFCLHSTKPSKIYSALSFSNERDLLLAFFEYMATSPPDAMYGHFSNTFDFDYLLRRADVLGIKCFPYFARFYSNAAKNNAGDKSKATKKGLFRPVTNVPGVMIWDTGNYVRDFRFAKTASLNALAAKELGKQKIEVEYSLISTLMQTEDGRTLLSKYCNYDVVLLELLDDKIGASNFLQEMANLCHVPMQLLGDRASTFRMTGLWLTYSQRYYDIAYPRAHPDAGFMTHPPGVTDVTDPSPDPLPAHIIDGDMHVLDYVNGFEDPTPGNTKNINSKTDPDLSHDTNKSNVRFLTPTQSLFDKMAPPTDKYAGGSVLTPTTGYFFLYLGTLDFQSLYPSIMIGGNFCFISIVLPGTQHEVCDYFKLDIRKDLYHEARFMLSYDQWTTVPYIDMKHKPSYVRKHIVKGLICYVEEVVLASREVSKRSMSHYYAMAKKEGNPGMKARLLFLAGVYNCRQMAKKIICNAMYGMLGMGGGTFSLRWAAESITNLARQALEFTRYKIFRYYRKKYGKLFNVLIIYGDTDSVFVIVLDLEDKDVPAITYGKPTESEQKHLIFDKFTEECKNISSYLWSSMTLQMEKLSRSGVLNTPKCYALMMTEKKDDPYFQKASGLSCVRRGGCKLQRDMCANMIKELIEQNNPAGAIENARNTIRRVLQREVKQHEILMRSSLSKEPVLYTKTLPPHVAMARILEKRGEAPLRAGDRVYFIVIARQKTYKKGEGSKKARVSDKVETPSRVLEKNIGYDQEYYLDLILKEACKVLRTTIDARSFSEKFEFSEWARIQLGLPGGKEVLAKAKTKLKIAQDKEVISVVLYGKQVDFAARKTPSFYDLPAKYQEDLPDTDIDWAGSDPNQVIPNIEDYKPPWLASTKDVTSLLKEMDTDEVPEEADDESDADKIFIDMQLAKGSMVDEHDIDSETIAPPNGKDAAKVAFMKVFSRESKKKKSNYNNVAPYVKKGHMSTNNPFRKFVTEEDNCMVCEKQIPMKLSGVCDVCVTIPANRYKRKHYHRKIVKDIEDMITEVKETDDICVECVTKSLGEVNRDIITNCFCFECPNWARRREAITDLSTNQKRRLPITELVFEEEEEEEKLNPLFRPPLDPLIASPAPFPPYVFRDNSMPVVESDADESDVDEFPIIWWTENDLMDDFVQ